MSSIFSVIQVPLPPGGSRDLDGPIRAINENFRSLTNYLNRAVASGAIVPSGTITLAMLSIIATARGDLIERGATSWQRLAIGSANKILKSDGIDPTWDTLSALLDALFSSTQGAVLYRGASSWAALAPGNAGEFLMTRGAAANPTWAVAVVRFFDPTFFDPAFFL